MLQVLGKPSSINVRKVLWLCDELQLACSNECWGTAARSTHEPAFLALNPNALVPVIRDGDFVLWESNAICRYLAAKHERTDLLPTAVTERAIVEQWMDWQATELNNAWRYAFMGLVRQHPDFADPRLIEASAANWNSKMQLLDAQLAQTMYVTGSTFTLADIVIGLSTHRWMMTPIERPALPAVADYYARLQERHGFQLHGCNGIP